MEHTILCVCKCEKSWTPLITHIKCIIWLNFNYNQEWFSSPPVIYLVSAILWKKIVKIVGHDPGQKVDFLKGEGVDDCDIDFWGV